ncbi:hypothetical protein MFU01_71580 [Myxococcus fulvus]|uniref:Uncharacterized protein n=1 Tax=Myxococcus fulvus TaxID=33 RepID=A0A511TD65_MYXFU|nr:hypothetical protein MFU01_71580 [Myxococcus fulvus]
MQIRGEVPRLIETRRRSQSTLVRPDDPSSELSLPQDRQWTSLCVIIETCESNEGVLLPDIRRSDDLIDQVMTVSDLRDITRARHGSDWHGRYMPLQACREPSPPGGRATLPGGM